MWICNRCQTANKDGYGQCVQCSAPRNARRFGAGNPVNAPSVQPAPTERRIQQPQAPETPPSPRRQSTPEPKNTPAKHAPGALARAVGGILAIALPALVLLLAALRVDVLKPFITGIFWGGAAPALTGLATDPTALAPVANAGLRPILEWLAYGVMALLCALLASLPGLALWSLGHLGRHVRKH